MLELIIMIGVISWFSKTAKQLGKNGFVWGLIGAMSYYGPVLIFGGIVLPELVAGSVTSDNVVSMMILGVILNVMIGIGCCYLARVILLASKPENNDDSQEVENICEAKEVVSM